MNNSSRNRIPLFILIISSASLITACSGTRPIDLGIIDNQLSPCPDRPNCVGSFENPKAGSRHIKPYSIIGGDNRKAWRLLESVIERNDNASIITKETRYIHAEFTSKLMRFVDDTEFMLDNATNTIHLRSASRLGYRDFEVNRERLEAIRSELQGKGAIE